MGLFGLRKKKETEAYQSPVPPDSPICTPTNASNSDHGLFRGKGSGLYRAIASHSKSFRHRRRSGKDPLMSPISPDASDRFSTVTKQESLLKSRDSGESEEVLHHSVKGLPTMSPTMAAIHARTMALIELHAKNDAEEPAEEPLDIAEMSQPGFSELASSDQKSSPADRSEPIRTLDSATRYEKKPDLQALSEHWIIDLKDLIMSKTIGHSSFGTVNEGKLNGTKVAVKTIHCDSRAGPMSNLSSFKKEAELNCKLRHPNIVLFMGIALKPTHICIVTELMSRGNVRDLLVAKVKGRSLRLDWSLRQQWALDTAQGMAYLHSLNPPMIHRDLKTTNLLVDRGMNVKICDFGLSRFKSDKLMSAVGTVHFAAPEVLNNEQYTERADLFSFGTVMWELYTRQCVFKGVPQIEIFKRVIDGQMPDVDEECDRRYRDLMMECWSIKAAKRPTFREVIDRLTVLVEELDTDSG